jgi:hypothetical protein
MTFPKRWLHESGAAHARERRALSAAAELEPPVGLEDRVWSELSNAVLEPERALDAAQEAPVKPEPPGPGLEAGASTASGTSSTFALAKSLGVGLALGALSMGGLELARKTSDAARALPSNAISEGARFPSGSMPRPASSEPAESRAQPTLRRAPATSAAQQAARVDSETVPPVTTINRAAGATAPSFPPASLAESAPTAAFSTNATGAAPLGVKLRYNALRDEARAVARAENLIRQGRLHEAEALLEESARRFGAGALSQERELLIIDTLGRLGKTALAEARARAFLQNHPHSQLAPKMRRLAGID